MKKIPTLFIRDVVTRRVTPAVTPGCGWVLEGKGVATRKWDGTACLVLGGKLYKRYDVHGNFSVELEDGRVVIPKAMYSTMLADGRILYHNKMIPPAFEPADLPDPVSGHWPGWVPVGDGPEDRWHREAVYVMNGDVVPPPDGTYELCGPKVQNNPEGLGNHQLIPHGKFLLGTCPRDFDGLRAYLDGGFLEGVVFWEDPGDPDCRKTKVKARDYGLTRRKS